MMTTIMKTKRVLVALGLLFSLIYSGTALGQVTIGSAQIPEEGALLQLKNLESSVDGGPNATKGLMLPRVSLTSATTLVDISKLASEADEIYAGLMVYNTNEESMCADDDITTGVHVWDGKQWKSMGGTKLISRRKELVDNRNGDIPQTYGTVHLQLVRPWDGSVVFDAGEWMIENLRARVYSNNITPAAGLPVLIASKAEHVIGRPEIRYYNYDGSDFNVRGYSYSTYSVFNGYDMTDQDLNAPGYTAPSRIQQGICPEGWRVPTYEDWKALSMAIANDNFCYFTKPYDATINYKPLDGVFSYNDEMFFSIAGYRGKSRSLAEGGLNVFAEDANDQTGFPSTPYWMTFPSPWNNVLSPFSSPLYLQSAGIGTVVQMSDGEFMPVRCVKGTAPEQIKYNSNWDHILPNN